MIQKVLAALVALVLVGDAVGLAVVDDDGDGTGRSGAPAAPEPAEVAAVNALVPELQRFVEAERGLPFKAPVKVELLEDGAFVARLRGVNERDEDAERIERVEQFLRALHLIDRDVSFEQSVDELLASAVAGFYDPEKDELVVRGGELTPYVRSVLVHELTHALQDQHFQLDRKELENRTDEASQAFSGLIEGDAVRIQRRYVGSLSAADRRAFLAEANDEQGPPEGVPDVLVSVLVFPYQAGPPFVDAVVAAGGQARLDAAFVTPPTTSEHLLHPETFLAGEGQRPVPDPPADGRVYERGVFGEFGILVLLRELLGPVGAARAAEGWGGDRYVAWTQGGRSCVRVRFVMDDSAELAELRAALRAWARRHDGATVNAEGPILFTSCG